MVTKDEALKMAIDCLEYHYKHGAWGMDIEGVIVSCQEALEQPCQECENLKHDLESYMKMAHAYANQKPLSDDEINELSDLAYKNGGWDIEFARYIEAKLKELNHES